MANLLEASKTITPAFALVAGMLALGIIPVHETSVSNNSASVQVAHYTSSAVGGVLHS